MITLGYGERTTTHNDHDEHEAHDVSVSSFQFPVSSFQKKGVAIVVIFVVVVIVGPP